jgi:hypothetical protein
MVTPRFVSKWAKNNVKQDWGQAASLVRAASELDGAAPMLSVDWLSGQGNRRVLAWLLILLALNNTKE